MLNYTRAVRPVMHRLRVVKELACPRKDGVEHRLGQLAGKRVLLARMERSNEPLAAGEYDLGAVFELRSRRALLSALPPR